MASIRPGQTSRRAPRAHPVRTRRVRPLDPRSNEPGDLPPDEWSDEPAPGDSEWLAPILDWDDDELGYDDERDLQQFLFRSHDHAAH